MIYCNIVTYDMYNEKKKLYDIVQNEESRKKETKAIHTKVIQRPLITNSQQMSRPVIVNNRTAKKTEKSNSSQFLKLIPKQQNNITTIQNSSQQLVNGPTKGNIDIQNVKIGVKVAHTNTVVKPLQQLQRLEPQQIHQIITTPQQTILQPAVPTSVMSTGQKPVILIAKKGMVSDQYFIPLASNGNVQNVPFSQNVQKIQMQPQQVIGQTQQPQTIKLNQNMQSVNTITTKTTVQQQPVIQQVQRVTHQVKPIPHKQTTVSSVLSSPKSHKPVDSKIVFCK